MDNPHLLPSGQAKSDEALAALALAATRAFSRHLDDNDLALWEMNAFSKPELDAIREHLYDCERCRIRVAEFLAGLTSKESLELVAACQLEPPPAAD